MTWTALVGPCGSDVVAHAFALVHEAGQQNDVVETQLADEALDMLALRAVTHEHETNVGTGARDERKGVEQRVELHPACEQPGDHDVPQSRIEP